MENPYRHSQDKPASADAQRYSDYELVIGPNRDYYMPKFEQFDAGGPKTGWHWPAFFVTAPWLLFRKMYGMGIFLLIVSCLLSLVFLGLLIAAVGVQSAKPEGLSPNFAAMAAVAFVVGLLPGALVAVFANSMYWKHVNKLIQDIPSTIAQNPDKRAMRLEKRGGTGAGPMIGVILGVGFFGFMVTGILAAIAIPAYQEYTIRAQVSEGFGLSAGYKAAVAEYYAQNEAWPENNEAAGVTPVTGKYVSSVTVDKGSVVIVFGNAANTNLSGKTLILLPGATESGDVVWVCANAESEEVKDYAPGPYGTDLPNKYLPSHCRKPAGGTG